MKYFSPGILDGSVTTAKLADGAVTTDKLADFAVTGAKLANNSVGPLKIVSNGVNQQKVKTVETSLSGVVPSSGAVELVLAPYAFWPMIHTTNLDKVRVTGHSVDSPGADNSRLALTNNTSGTENYDLDYRNIDT